MVSSFCGIDFLKRLYRWIDAEIEKFRDPITSQVAFSNFKKYMM